MTTTRLPGDHPKRPSQVPPVPGPRPGIRVVHEPVAEYLGRDPGSRQYELAAFIAVLVLLPLVVFLQQFTIGLAGQTLTSAPEAVSRSEAVDDPGVGDLATLAKIAVKMAYLAQSADGGDDYEIDDPAAAAAELDEIAWTRVDRLRVAIVAGELEGPEAALQRLSALEEEVDPAGDLARDVQWLRTLYEKGSAAVTDEAGVSLAARHGWFGRLALSTGLHESEPRRWEVVSGGVELIVLFGSLGIAGMLAGLAGLVLFALGVAAWRKGRLEPAFEPPDPGGSVYLETFAVFLGGFLLMQLFSLALFGAGVEGTTGALAFTEVMVWGLVATLAWPRVRGVSWGRMADDLGWTRGEGSMKEAWFGVIGYLAGLPVLILGTYIASIIEAASGGTEESIGYGMFQPPPGNGWMLVALGVLSAVVWAPVVEETIFRGALYRHLHARTKVLGAVLISAAAFGMVHPYTTAGLVHVALIGVTFAALREWRGSLIAPVVAHALHNGTIAFTTVAVLKVLGE